MSRHGARTLAVLVALVAGAVPAEAGAAGCPGADALPGSVRPAEARQATQCLLNAERARRGLRPLRADRRLAKAARGHGRDMVSRRYFAHDSLDGRDFAARIRATGYVPRTGGLVIGENLAWGSMSLGTPREIVSSWMASPPHRRNILNRRFSAIGIAIVKGAPGAAPNAATYVTEFGHRG